MTFYIYLIYLLPFNKTDHFSLLTQHCLEKCLNLLHLNKRWPNLFLMILNIIIFLGVAHGIESFLLQHLITSWQTKLKNCIIISRNQETFKLPLNLPEGNLVKIIATLSPQLHNLLTLLKVYQNLSLNSVRHLSHPLHSVSAM